MATIRLRGLSRRYLGAEGAALAGLDLEVADGEVLVVVGPSGCGKSTTLRLIAGLDAPDAGTIAIDGRDVGQTPPQERDVAMVFQGYALYPHLTVRENIAFPLKMRGIARAERARRAEEAAGTLGLAKLLDRRPGELSGGERQRVAMGRAIVRSPKVFLFDEPLSNLDAALRAELRVELASMVRRLGTTSLYVTHDQIEAMTLGDRIAVLERGALQQIGTPRAVYEDPENAFVAGFLGTPPMNLIELAVEGGRARRSGVDLPAPEALHLPPRVQAGVRPEHLSIEDASTAARAGDVGILAEVVATEPLGPETYVYLEVDGARLRARARGFDGPTRGEKVRLALDPRHLLWFDASSGRRCRGPAGAPPS
jgi:multiple sugar transport system ATP-binding protein